MKMVSTQDKIHSLINTRDEGMLFANDIQDVFRFQCLLEAGRLEELDDADYDVLDELYLKYTE